MQRVLTALMTFLSLLAANLVPAGAQSPPADANGQGRAPIADVLELPAGRTVPTLVVRDKTFVLSGHVAQDVMAINCHTVIRPGASVGNVLTAIGGTVQDENEGRVRVVQQSADLLPYLQQTIIQSVAAPPRTVHVSHVVVQSQSPKKSCAGAQFALFLVGLLSGLIALVVAPGATEHTGEALAREPGRSLVVGALTASGMLFLLCLGYGLTKSPFSPVAIPVGAGFAGLCLGVLAFGWVCGMRFIGQSITRRLGRSGSVGLFLQFALGLGAFCMATALLGSVYEGLGVIGLLMEFLFALTGLGAAVLSGFGADPNWLTARLRGEVRWMSRSPRL